MRYIRWMATATTNTDGCGPAPAVTEWAGTTDILRRTGLLPLLGFLATRCDISAPQLVEAAAVECFHASTMAAQRLRAQSEEISRAWAYADVPAIVRKGVHVSRLYPEPGCRPFGDIDVLVPSDRLSQALATAAQLGFGHASHSRELRRYLRLAASTVTLCRLGGVGDPKTVVDISSSLFLGVQDLDLDFATIEAHSQDLGESVRGLGRIQLLIDLINNLYVTSTTMRYVNGMRFQRLTSYVDLLVVGGFLTTADWVTLQGVIETKGLQRAAAFALGNCVTLFPEHPRVAPMARVLGSFDDSSAADEYGQWEMTPAGRWPVDITQRVRFERLPYYVQLPRLPQ